MLSLWRSLLRTTAEGGLCSPRKRGEVERNSRRAIADRRLERQRGIPGEENPGVLRYLGDESIDQRTPHLFAMHGCEMGCGQHLANQPSGLAGVHEIVDDQ